MLWDFYILANKSSIPPKPLTQYHIFGSIGGLKSLTSHKMFFSITFLYCATVVALTILSAKHYVKMVLESAKIINFTCLLDQKHDECIISTFTIHITFCTGQDGFLPQSGCCFDCLSALNIHNFLWHENGPTYRYWMST